MKLAQSRYDNSETGCCARLDPTQWDEKEIVWNEKPFLRDRIREFLHVPVNFGSVMTRDHTAIEDAEAYPESPLWLTDEVSPWRSDIYMAVDRDVPGMTMTTLSGTFLTKVFEGPYRDAGRWTREMEAWVRSRGREVEKIYYYFATCPKCSKTLGENRVVLFARVR